MEENGNGFQIGLGSGRSLRAKGLAGFLMLMLFAQSCSLVWVGVMVHNLTAALTVHRKSMAEQLLLEAKQDGIIMATVARMEKNIQAVVDGQAKLSDTLMLGLLTRVERLTPPVPPEQR